MKESPKKKREYVAPTVTDHGDLRELTKGGGSGGKDSGGGSSLKTKNSAS
jgi:hypothetical protein